MVAAGVNHSWRNSCNSCASGDAKNILVALHDTANTSCPENALDLGRLPVLANEDGHIAVANRAVTQERSCILQSDNIRRSTHSLD